MPEYTNLNIKMDRDLKAQAEQMFNAMGMTLTTAINVFVRQAVLENSIPFKISRNSEAVTQNPEHKSTRREIQAPASTPRQRRAAMQEIRELLAGIDGNSVDLDQLKQERRSARFERDVCVQDH